MRSLRYRRTRTTRPGRRALGAQFHHVRHRGPGGYAGPPSETEALEAKRAKELAGQGYLRRLWALPGRGRALGLWQAAGPAELQALLRSLPLDPWMTVQTTPLTPHPSDPAQTP